MSDTFSIQRYSWLLRLYWTESRLWLILMGVSWAGLIFVFSRTNPIVERNILSLFLLFNLVISFRYIDQAKRLSSFLLLPALSIEKLSFLLSAGVIFPLAYHYAFCWIVDIVPLFHEIRYYEIAVSEPEPEIIFVSILFAVMLIVYTRFRIRSLNLFRCFALLLICFTLLSSLKQMPLSMFLSKALDDYQNIVGNYQYRLGEAVDILIGDIWPEIQCLLIITLSYLSFRGFNQLQITYRGRF